MRRAPSIRDPSRPSLGTLPQSRRPRRDLPRTRGLAGILQDVATTSASYLVSDAIAQKAASRNASLDDLDWSRGARYVSFGCIDGALSHLWFARLDRVVGALALPSFAPPAGVKVVCDLCLFTPAWSLVFLLYMELSQGSSAEKALARVREEWGALYAGNLLAWGPFTFVLYSIIPLKWRVPALNVFNVLYTIVLSFWAERNRQS